MKLKGNPLAGEGKTHSEFGGNFISAIAEPTMSSLEMVDYINADRKAKAKAEGLPFRARSIESFPTITYSKSPEGVG
jgi:hypothetical protein